MCIKNCVGHPISFLGVGSVYEFTLLFKPIFANGLEQSFQRKDVPGQFYPNLDFSGTDKVISVLIIEGFSGGSDGK